MRRPNRFGHLNPRTLPRGYRRARSCRRDQLNPPPQRSGEGTGPTIYGRRPLTEARNHRGTQNCRGARPAVSLRPPGSATPSHNLNREVRRPAVEGGRDPANRRTDEHRSAQAGSRSALDPAIAPARGSCWGRCGWSRVLPSPDVPEPDGTPPGARHPAAAPRKEKPHKTGHPGKSRGPRSSEGSRPEHPRPFLLQSSGKTDS